MFSIFNKIPTILLIIIKTKKIYYYKNLPFNSILKPKRSTSNSFFKLISLNIIFEKNFMYFFTNNTTSNNNFYLAVNYTLLENILKYIKFELFFSNTYMFDSICFQLNSNLTIFSKIFKKKLKNKIFLTYSMYNPIYYTRISLITIYENKQTIVSLEKFYKNLNWLERELSEFFNIKYIRKNDTRNLLLDYNDNNNYLLKQYNTELFTDLYYNLINDTLSESKNQNTNI
jgi:NADH:ubiquinone oxidoreductase subunit C